MDNLNKKACFLSILKTIKEINLQILNKRHDLLRTAVAKNYIFYVLKTDLITSKDICQKLIDRAVSSEMQSLLKLKMETLDNE